MDGIDDDDHCHLRLVIWHELDENQDRYLDDRLSGSMLFYLCLSFVEENHRNVVVHLRVMQIYPMDFYLVEVLD